MHCLGCILSLPGKQEHLGLVREKKEGETQKLFLTPSPLILALGPGCLPGPGLFVLLALLPEPFQTLPGPASTLGFQNSSTVW